MKKVALIQFNQILNRAIAILISGTILSTSTFAFAGSRCGSESNSLNWLFKTTSSDWWPSLSLIPDVTFGWVSNVLTGSFYGYLDVAKVACVSLYGQAYLGNACRDHDGC